MTMSVVDVQPKKSTQIPAIKQQTCHIKCTFLISDYYKFIAWIYAVNMSFNQKSNPM